MVKGNVTSSWVALLRSSKGNSQWLTKSVGNCSLAVESCNDGVVDVVEGMIEGGWSRGWQCARDAGPTEHAAASWDIAKSASPAHGQI